jgi:hypothetical protein
MGLVQGASGSWGFRRVLLLFFQHFKRGIDGVSKEVRSYRAATDVSGSDKFDVHAAIRRWSECAGSDFYLYRAVYHPVGRNQIEIDERSGIGVSVGWCTYTGLAGRVCHDHLHESQVASFNASYL